MIILILSETWKLKEVKDLPKMINRCLNSTSSESHSNALFINYFSILTHVFATSSEAFIYSKV
jgi:hypothetical protein